jgi:hypothetical protein
VDAASAPRICRYLLSCAHFLPEGEGAAAHGTCSLLST